MREEFLHPIIYDSVNQPAMLFVEHDQYFAENIATKTVEYY